MTYTFAGAKSPRYAPLLFLVLAMSAGCIRAKRPRKNDHTAYIKEAITKGEEYLVGRTTPHGMFLYRERTSGADPARYNILRHAGTLRSLVHAHTITEDQLAASALLRAASFMKTATLKPLLGESPHLSAIWSLPEITGIELPTAKLGGTGLALSVLVDIETIEPGFTPVEQLRAMGAFLRHMQKQDGDFYFRFIPSKGGRQATPRSRFYAGEAALGLISLYERDPDPRWLAAGVKALMFLVRAQKGEAAELNAWALIAMERLFLMDHLPETLYPRTQFSAYVQRQVKLIASRCLRTSTSGITGCFNEWGAVADTASHLEALLAAFTILKMGKKQERELRYLLALGVGFLLRAQIKKGPYAGGFPKAIGAVARNAAHDEEFVRTAGEIRIDYVQHSLSALSQYYVLLEEE